MKYRRILIIVLGLFPLVSSGYFEDRYRCTLHPRSIEVSLSTGEKTCFVYLAGVSQLVQKTKYDIEQANQNYDAGKDSVYRSGVILQLEDEYDALLQTQQDLLLAVKDFEQELFLRVKRLVWYYLKPGYDTLIDKLEQAEALEHRLLVLGNTEQYAFVRSQMARREREITLLERIRESGNFEQLVPLLRRRMQLQSGEVKL